MKVISKAHEISRLIAQLGAGQIDQNAYLQKIGVILNAPYQSNASGIEPEEEAQLLQQLVMKNIFSNTELQRQYSLLAASAPKKKKGKVALIVIGVIVILIIIGAVASGGNDSAPVEPATPAPEPITEATPAEPGFKFNDEAVEDEIGMFSYIIQNVDDFFNLSDSKKQALAEALYDVALPYIEANHPEVTSILITVYTQNSEVAFQIDRPNRIVTPKVSFQKPLPGGSTTFDYYWYDNRFGNGQTW